MIETNSWDINETFFQFLKYIVLMVYNYGVRYFAPWEKCNTFCIPFYDSYNSVQFMKYSRLFFTLGTQFVLEAKIMRKSFLENKGGFWAFEMLKDKVHDHTEKWLFSEAIIWQYRTQIPELVFFVFTIIWFCKLLFCLVIKMQNFSYPLSC